MARNQIIKARTASSDHCYVSDDLESAGNHVAWYEIREQLHGAIDGRQIACARDHFLKSAIQQHCVAGD